LPLTPGITEIKSIADFKNTCDQPGPFGRVFRCLKETAPARGIDTGAAAREGFASGLDGAGKQGFDALGNSKFPCCSKKSGPADGGYASAATLQTPQ
jgi:hypothetical protein